jgi:hypothetical protein
MKLTKKHTIGIVSALACLIIVSVLYMAMAAPKKKVRAPRPQVIVATVAPTQAPETEAPEDVQAINDTDDLTSHIRVGGMTVLYPRVPLLEMRYQPKRYELVPGAILPGMRGRRIEDATHVIATTYPGLVVRAIHQTQPLNLEVRRDRVTVVVDAYTKRVVSARIG